MDLIYTFRVTTKVFSFTNETLANIRIKILHNGSMFFSLY